MVTKFNSDSSFPPNPALLRRVRDWLADHPGSALSDVSAGVYPGKTTGQSRVSEALYALRGRCQVRLDGERWYPAG